MIGRAQRRVEDERLITGRGAYLDDLPSDGVVHAVFVRSPLAHGTVGEIEAAEARRMPGVLGVFTALDLGLARPMPNMHPTPLTDGVQAHPLAMEEVCHVGEAVAVVVAEDRYQAADAAGAVWVEGESLPATVDYLSALEPGAAPVHRGSTSNRVATLRAQYGDVEAAMRVAAHVIDVELSQHRGAAAFIEPRGVLAVPAGGDMAMWTSTQSPHRVRDLVGGYLGLEDLRVVAPDVGGGFGPKASAYAEEYVVPALTRHLGRPVKWVETRREHFLVTNQQRDQAYRLQVACDARGRILALRGVVIHDNGAYLPYGLLLPATGLNLIPGPYVIEALDVTIDVVYTNLVPTSPIRGAGRPNAVFAMERCVDAVARTLEMDPAEVRRRNFVVAGADHRVPLEARTREMIRYDGGDYPGLLEAALRLADRSGFPTRRAKSLAGGLRRGIGVASYVEDTGLGPSEGARVEVSDEGSVVVRVGVSSQGQGHATVFAQLAAAELGVAPEDVVVVAGDTAGHPVGTSTVASRTAVTAGPAVHQAAGVAADSVRQVAADLLEASVEDLVLGGGAVSVVGQPGASVSLAEVAARAADAGVELAGETTVPFGMAAYAYGTHVAEVEVDPETGAVAVVAYTVSHDCGTVLNPMIVAGQTDGGVAHGLGNALTERVAHTPDGQPLVTTFLDYRIPSAVQVPSIAKFHTETPSSTNSLGAKGAGEGGTIPVAAAIAAAVEDALSEFGVVVDRYPLDPQTVLGLIQGH
jgi:carbon-monoxide dehydrogenase large subunit